MDMKIRQINNTKFYISNNEMDEVKLWLIDNIDEDSYAICDSADVRKPPSSVVWLLDEEDSMGFKMRWL